MFAISSAHAAIINWVNPAGGSSITLTNWTPQQIPGPADSAVFGLSGSYTVDWAVGSPSVVSLISVGGGASVGLTLSTPLEATNCNIQTFGSSNGILTVRSGQLTAGATTGGLSVGAAGNAGGPALGGTLNIQSPAADVVVNANCRIGSNNDGFVNILGGGLLSSNALVRIGDFDVGSVVVSGVDATTLTRSTLQTTGAGDTLLVGNGPSGTLDVASGALVSIADNIVIANLVSSPTSAVTVGGASNGFDATLSTAANLFVGNNNSPSNLGRGRLTLNAGGRVIVPLATVIGDPQGGSALLTMNGGTLTTHDLTLTPTTGSFTFSGGTLTLTGGSLTASSTITPAAAAIISGSGTLDANIANAGSIQPTGAGFTLLGNLSDNGTGVSGTRLTFAGGSSYTGDGVLSCEIAALAGSTFAPSGFITMGNLSSANGVEFDGVMNINNTTIECFDSNGARIGGTVNLNNGELSGLTGLRFQGGLLPRLTGNGTLSDDCTMYGRVEPGIATGDATGHIDFVTLTMGVTGSLHIDIEGEAAGQYDTVSTIDEFDLGGASSLIVNRLHNFYPARGARFPIITGGRFDTFGTVLAPGFHVEYLPGGVDLVFDGLCDSIDFNNDELFPDTADIDDLLSVFSGGPCSNDPNCNDTDFNNDGLFPDTADIDDFLRVFSGGPCL
jgi:hypothetical protein